MDLRLLILLVPILLALGWAAFNILPAAKGQVSDFFNSDKG